MRDLQLFPHTSITEDLYSNKLSSTTYIPKPLTWIRSTIIYDNNSVLNCHLRNSKISNTRSVDYQASTFVNLLRVAKAHFPLYCTKALKKENIVSLTRPPLPFNMIEIR